MARHPKDQPERWWPEIAFGLAVLAVYLLTLARSVAGGDSGEFITVTATLGVAHPPGYPLYTLLGHVFTRIPVGTIAWRVNLFSAVAAATAAALLFTTIRRLTRSIAASIAGASLFAFAPHVWQYAVTAEVFALNSLFAAGLLYFSWRVSTSFTIARAAMVFFWIGLALSNHHAIVFYALPIAVVTWHDAIRHRATARQLGALITAALAGLLPDAYLPIASSRSATLMSWGDQTTLKGFVATLLRSDYGTFQLQAAPGAMGFDAVGRLHLYLSNALTELAFVGVPLALVGIAVTVRRDRFTRWWLLAWLFYVIAFNYLDNVPLAPGPGRIVSERFWSQAHLVVCLFAGLGFAAVAGVTRTWQPIAGLITASALAVVQVVTNMGSQDRRADVSLRGFSQAILDTLPTGAILITRGDHVFHTLRYLQLVEGYRPDVRVLDQKMLAYDWFNRRMQTRFPDLELPGAALSDRGGSGYTISELLRLNLPRAPIYLCDTSMDPATLGDVHVWPEGLVDIVLPSSKEPTVDQWLAATDSSLGRVDIAALDRHPVDSWEHAAASYYWVQTTRTAIRLSVWATAHDHTGALIRSGDLLKKILEEWPDAPVALHKNLGIIYKDLSVADARYLPLMRQQFERYLASGPTADPDLPVLRQLLQLR